MNSGGKNENGKLLIATILLAVVFIGQISLAQVSIIDERQARLDYMRSIPVTSWPKHIGGEPIDFDEWRAKRGEPGSFMIDMVKKSVPANKSDAGIFCIYVNSDLFPQIESSVDTYIDDLIADGYTVNLYQTSGGTEVEFKQSLQAQYSAGMIGCILIGDLPIAWYEEYCWDVDETFPSDLYYMDMDGIWEDLDSNGIYDSHSGDQEPEIIVGRLTASPMTIGGVTEADLVNNYFAKNHNYRTNRLFLNNRALAYIDDDWQMYSSEWGGAVEMAYDSVTTVAYSAETIAADYEARLDDNYESILLCAHSWPNGHSFKVGTEWIGGDTYVDEVVTINPKAHFYNLFACSNTRYVEIDYMGGWYIFCDSYGLASIGSTKTGSMLYFEDFYGPFSQGVSIGQAFLEWFIAMAEFGYSHDDICWFYGMTLCGDPTLRHIEPQPVSIITDMLSDGDFNLPYSDTLDSDGGIPPFQYTVTDGSLPEGLTLNGSEGIISGVCAEAGTFSFTVQAQDSGIPYLTGAKEIGININFMCGDVDGSVGINILDITYIISYLYKGGPVPPVMDAADVNASGGINVLDITVLIGYLYKSGPPPICP